MSQRTQHENSMRIVGTWMSYGLFLGFVVGALLGYFVFHDVTNWALVGFSLGLGTGLLIGTLVDRRQLRTSGKRD